MQNDGGCTREWNGSEELLPVCWSMSPLPPRPAGPRQGSRTVPRFPQPLWACFPQYFFSIPLIEKCWIALSRPVSAQDRLHGPPISLLLLSVRRLLPEPSCRFFMILKQVLSAWYDKQRKLFAVNPLWSLSTSRSVSSSSAAGIVSSSSTFSATSSLEPVAQAYHVCGVHKCRRSLYRPSLASTAPSASCACRELHSLAREANALNETGCLVKDTHKQSLSKSLA